MDAIISCAQSYSNQLSPAVSYVVPGTNSVVYSQVLEAFQQAENEKLGSPELAFTDVYDEMPPRLKRQLEETKQHVAKYQEHYPVDKHLPF